MTKKIILGLAGKIACGKSTASNYLIKYNQGVKFGFSDSLREVLDIYDLPITRENMQNLSTLLRKNLSEDILAKAMVKKAREAKNNLVVVDGIRRFTDIENFLKLKNFFLIYIEADQKKRYERYIKRNESPGDAEMSWAEFQERDAAESETQIEALKDKAHYIINNNQKIELLYKQIDDILISLLNT